MAVAVSSARLSASALAHARARFAVIAAAFVLVFAFDVARAWAQYTDLRGAIVVGLTFTDNVQGAPKYPREGERSAEPGFLLNIGPTGRLIYERPRMLTELNLNTAMAFQLGVGDQINLTNRLEGRLRYEITEVTQIEFALRGGHVYNTLFPEPAPGQALRVVVPGIFNTVNAEVAETLGTEVVRDLRFNQAFQANLTFPLDSDPPRPRAYNLGLNFNLTRADDPQNVGVNFGSALAIVDQVESSCATDQDCGANQCVFINPERTVRACRPRVNVAGEEPVANAPQLTNQLNINYAYDFKNGFTANGNVGVQQVMRATDGGGQFWQPAGRGQIRFEYEDFATAANYNYNTQLNPDLGTLQVGHNATLQVNFAIDRKTREIGAALQGAYQYATDIDTNGRRGQAFHAFAGDAAITWQPQWLLPNFQAAIRYQYRLQSAEDDPYLFFFTERHAVTINGGFEFPEPKPVK